MWNADDLPQKRGKWTTAVRLLGARTQLVLVLLTGWRILVGICDLLVAAAMYALFLLLQGHTHVHWPGFWSQTTLSLGWITAALVVIRAVMDLGSARITFSSIQGLQVSMLLRLVQGWSEMQWSQFVGRNRSEMVNIAMCTTREAADFYYRWIELAAAITTVAVMTAVIVYQNFIAACSFAVMLAAIYGLHRFVIRSRLQAAAGGREESARALQKDLADMLAAGKETRIYDLHSFFCHRVRLQAQRMAKGNTRAVFLPQIGRVIADQGAVLLFLAIIVVVQMLRGDARDLLALLAFYFVLSRRLLPLISQISFFAGQMEASFESVRMVDAALHDCDRHRADISLPELPQAGFTAELIQIRFGFDRSAPILRDLSLNIREGEMVVLHGASGIGKSSLLLLIAGVFEPQAGIARRNRKGTAYVPQEVPLLDDSIRNNLLLELRDKSDEELMEALRATRLDAFVAAQPHGLDTQIGDNGALLSGGQRQRLGLARALLRRSDLLLLDEATSALDVESERQILEALRSSRKSILLVTHRSGARPFADRVLQLQNGGLLEVVAETMALSGISGVQDGR